MSNIAIKNTSCYKYQVFLFSTNLKRCELLIMNPEQFEQAILDAIASDGEQTQATQAYFAFLKSELHLPIEKSEDADAEPRVLFLEQDQHVFLPIFSNLEYLAQWAGDQINQIDQFTLTGVELLKGLGDNVTLALNPGFDSYKEFNPDEIAKLKTMVLKIQNLIKD